MLKVYEFTITLQGTGNDDEEAWINAVEGFRSDPGCSPEDSRVVQYIRNEKENPCESCRKCGENTCGNDTGIYECFEPLED